MIEIPSFLTPWRDRSLGVARRTRTYDLPLNKSPGTGFIILLVGLMTFLGMMALSGTFVLSAMSGRWTSGLENRMTIEIPAETPRGVRRSPDEVQGLASKTAVALHKIEGIQSIKILSKDDIAELVGPWLGDLPDLEKLPIPGLITVELSDAANEDTIQTIQRKISLVSPNIRIETHEEWLSDLLHFTGALQFAALIIALIILITTIIAVAGAVRSRMAIHHEEVELLHLMGARDTYISRQFQRHAMILAIQGAAVGTVAGMIILGAMELVSGGMKVSLIPDFSLGPIQFLVLTMLPLIIAAIASLTARQTVLRVLEEMP